MQIKHVFFDLDHTLWDFETNSKKAYELCFQNHKIGVELDVFLNEYVRINFDYWKLYRDEKVTKEALKYGRLKDSFDAVAYDISDKLIYQIAKEYLEHLPNFNTLFDGTIEILDYLMPKYQLHIITNGFSEVQDHKLKKSGISHYFTQMITSESVGVKKPNPRVFNYALHKANATAEQSMMIGDSLEADVQGALNVGMQAIHFNPTEIQSDGKHVVEIKNLVEIKRYL